MRFVFDFSLIRVHVAIQVKNTNNCNKFRRKNIEKFALICLSWKIGFFLSLVDFRKNWEKEWMLFCTCLHGQNSEFQFFLELEIEMDNW